MTDRRPDRVYGILVRDGEVFLALREGELTLPGGVFRPLAEDRKAELKAHIWDQLALDARAIWAQGAFDYRAPGEDRPYFSGFYTVWEWSGAVPEGAGQWAGLDAIAVLPLNPSLKILLTSVLNTLALRTT